MNNQANAKPFIKWVGGKGHLLNEIAKKYPIGLGDNINTYIEPFVGGGAVLFDILQNYSLKRVIINDINPRLINLYELVRDDVESLIEELAIIEEYYHSLSEDRRKQYFYSEREKFNGGRLSVVEESARFIFLNKTCFNGLYRENKNGLFNVPFGRYKNPKICDSENLRMASNLLKDVIIFCGDYAKAIDYADANSFVYLDPPYRPISKDESFTSYHKCSLSSDADQVKLAMEIEKIASRGAFVLLSNSDPKTNDEGDDFFDLLYSKSIISRISVRRFVGGVRKNSVSELLISNY